MKIMNNSKIFLLILLAVEILLGAVGCTPAKPGNSDEQPSGAASQSGRATTQPSNAITQTTDTPAQSGGAATHPGNVAVLAADLMHSVTPNRVNGKVADNAFTESMADFSIELFKKSMADKENSLISPLSVVFALAMTANGADNETLAQMEKLLGGDLPLAELNEYLYSYADSLPSADKSRLEIANSIWFCNYEGGLLVKPDFLQRNADYYGAAAFSSAFDSQTVSDINNWVKTNTDGMIDRIIDEILDGQEMFLINAVMFDAEWQSVYYTQSIREGEFTDITGAKQKVDFMHSSERKYLDDGMATGFIKVYNGGSYSFAALLPNEGVSIDDYIESLTGEGFLSTLNNAQSVEVNASMPKFEYEYGVEMSSALKALGMPDAFDANKADFSAMADSPQGKLFISFVLHKTFIAVDELGTKAGAVTMVAMAPGAAPNAEVPKVVRLDRPFVYAIIDNATNLPIFIGTLMNV